MRPNKTQEQMIEYLERLNPVSTAVLTPQEIHPNYWGRKRAGVCWHNGAVVEGDITPYDLDFRKHWCRWQLAKMTNNVGAVLDCMVAPSCGYTPDLRPLAKNQINKARTVYHLTTPNRVKIGSKEIVE